MRRTVNGVRGDLLRWARLQQELTMRSIHDNCGPSPGYQSEVENGKKGQVQVEMLSGWINLLNVSETFARGQITKYHLNPRACEGLAWEIGSLVLAGRSDLPNWIALNERERVRAVLRLVAHESQSLPRVVLAWVLDLDLRTLNDLLVGALPIMKVHMEATMQITRLPATFFTFGSTAQFEQYLPVFYKAVEWGISPEELLTRIKPPPSAGTSICGA